MQHWHSWTTFKGLPLPGSLSEQPARLLEAISVLEGESMLYSMRRQEIAASRARRKG